MTINHTRLLSSDLELEVGPKEAPRQNKEKAIVLEYSIKHNASKSVGEMVDYGYLPNLIDEKKKVFGIDCRISKKTIVNFMVLDKPD